MKTITIKGSDKHIYNIIKENRIRAKRGYITITGDTELEGNAARKAMITQEVAETEAKKAKAEAKNMAKLVTTKKAAKKALEKKEIDEKLAIKAQEEAKIERMKKEDKEIAMKEAATKKAKEDKEAELRQTKEEKTKHETK